MALSRRQIVREALKGIGSGIDNLTKIHVRINPTNAPGSEGEHYPIGGYLPDRFGNFGTMRDNIKDGQVQQVHTWPAVIEATEVLIGAALVTAQEYIGKPGTDRHRNICHLANFWKHRGEWGFDWANVKSPGALKTKAAIEAMDEDPPMTRAISLGQLTRLVQKVLGEPFTVNALYNAISDITVP